MANAKVTFKQTGSLERVAKSDELGDQLEAIAAPALRSAQRDPNAAYVASLRMRRFVSRGREGRVSIQIGADPVLGSRVEAKRGTLARALGEAGLT
jgi:hypothetical protein